MRGEFPSRFALGALIAGPDSASRSCWFPAVSLLTSNDGEPVSIDDEPASL
jgi:hypothetical protein